MPSKAPSEPKREQYGLAQSAIAKPKRGQIPTRASLRSMREFAVQEIVILDGPFEGQRFRGDSPTRPYGSTPSRWAITWTK